VFCQILISFGGGAIVITEQIAAMAATDHQYLAVVLAVEGMMSSIGGAIDSSIGSATWINSFPTSLEKHLPTESRANFTAIYMDLNTQLSYPKGSPTRLVIENAYGEVQMYMCVIATAVFAVGVVAILMWKDIRVSGFKQVKGRVV
jgi:hypothetical protein